MDMPPIVPSPLHSGPSALPLPGEWQGRQIIDLSHADVAPAALQTTLKNVQRALRYGMFSTLPTDYPDQITTLKQRHISYLQDPQANPLGCESLPILGKIIRFFYNLYATHKAEKLFAPIERLMETIGKGSTLLPPRLTWENGTYPYRAFSSRDLGETADVNLYLTAGSSPEAIAHMLQQIEEYLTKGGTDDALSSRLPIEKKNLLFLAMEHDCSETIRFLVRNGISPLQPLLFATVSYTPSFGGIPISALGMAIRSRNTTRVKMLLEAAQERDPFFRLPDDNAQRYNAKYHDAHTGEIERLLQTYT